MTNDITEGAPEPLGATLTDNGVNVAVFSANASAIEYCLFDAAGVERRFRLPARTGDVFHGHIGGVSAGALYGLRAHGPYDPANGHRFNPNKLLMDPYAIAIDRKFRLHPSMFAERDGHFDDTDSADAMPKAIITRPNDFAPPKPLTPWPETIIYELHVRGFTMHHPDIPAELRGSFAGLAHPAAIDHLVRLGVTSVEVLPSAAWIEERHLAAAGLTNYWGYNPVALMAPDPGLAPGGWPEVRAAVAALAAAGIETIVDVVLNHTGEGDELGPTLSFRGLDNASYYRLQPNDPARYIDDTGTGNSLGLDHPQVVRLAMEALRSWAIQGGVHGFRYDLATAMGRRPDGFDPTAPLITAIAQDPVLRDLKMIAEPWDIGPGGYQLGAFPPGWGEWNDRFRDAARRFWRGDAGTLSELATRLAGSADVFAGKHRPSRGINFITAHDGFTLADLVSYEYKHNEANGEGNRDGTGDNLSWNNGTEGATADPAISGARKSDQRALLATLLLARGTPMLSMGAEFGQSQSGNNNAYSQDSDISWLNWSAADPELLAWSQLLIGLRRNHPTLHQDRFLTGTAEGTLPDVTWLRPDGQPPTGGDWQAEHGDAVIVVLFCETPVWDRVALLFNRGRDGTDMVLPPPSDGHEWQLLADSATDRPLLSAATFHAPPRSVSVFAEQASKTTSRPPTNPLALRRLAAAAGIATNWWEVDGTAHNVSDDTRRALLTAMGLASSTTAEARNSLAALADERDRRVVPHAVTLFEGETFRLALPLEPGLNARPVWLNVALEDGSVNRIRVRDESLSAATASDLRPLRIRNIPLPALPIGRHRLWLDDFPDVVCHLTIAPPRCFLPAALANGARRFGISAQVYSLRRAGDQGIGDFTTLATLAKGAAGQGAAIVAINPLHALFPQQRDRASPYHPSDRHFLDPIYLDLATLDDGLGPLPATAEWSALAQQSAVDYPAVWVLKRAVLEQRFLRFEAAGRNADFTAFVTAGRDALYRFATFETIAESQGKPWQHWPEALRNARGRAITDYAEAHPDRVRFHLYLQFLAERQLAAASANGLELGLLRDLAVGAAPDGAEAWAGRDQLAYGASIGAPPDPFTAEGQIWGLPPPNPLAGPRDGFAGFAGLLAANMRHAGGLRIDHVMGMTRLFWVPDGSKGADGAYVGYPFRHMLGQLTLASQRAGCLVVGEDLGTVPEMFRETLAGADILSYRVLLLERDDIGFKPPSAYAARALASVSTHDLPTFAGWLQGADITEQARLGLVSDEAGAIEHRGSEIAALGDALRREDILAPATDPAAAHAFVARSPASIVLAQADDLDGETIGVNLPGTDSERPNWRRKVATPLPELLLSPTAQAILSALRDERPADT